ncbi:uncharacterized protein LOC143028000 [Oratosquilla oratoria]|uniref:uncharacterized protein LOC143028000 n=1 Tax=Oratosquilla oratoria TaxID=337810 RepID=UPI003F773880
MPVPDGFGEKVNSRKELRDAAYGDIREHIGDHKYFEGIATVPPTNDNIDEINTEVQDTPPGKPRVYYSVDKPNEEEELEVQVSTLNDMNPPSVPLHKLILKDTVVVMIMRNLKSPKLCNGNRIAIDVLRKYIVIGRI